MDRRDRKNSKRAWRPESYRGDVDPIVGKSMTAALKCVFDEYASEPVPERFLELIDELERQAMSGDDNVDLDKNETDADR